jgi:membrane fusion protein, multidrug efflux system
MNTQILNLRKVAFVVFAFTMLISCKQKQAEKANVILSYPVTTLTEQEVVLLSTYPAIIKGQEDVEIKPRIDGFIEAVNVDEGTIVKKGQILFKINSPSAIQSLENAKAIFNTAKLDVERMRPLAEKGIISNVQLKTYENTFASAQATLNQAQSTLSWTNVTSPVDGVVGTMAYRLGSLVNSSNILTTVANTTNVYANFSLNEKELLEFLRSWKGGSQAEKIKNMPDVKLLLADGSEYEVPGRIETISGVMNAATGSINLRAKFSNKEGLLLSGTSGKIVIPKTLKNVFLIPQKATFSQQDKVLAYKVQGDSVVQKIITVASTPDGINYAVTSGLANGDKIVIDGISTLKNGKEIKIN